MSKIERPMRGIETFVNPQGIRILYLRWDADEQKDQEWYDREYARSVDKALFKQEQDISFFAKLGTKIYHAFNPEYTVVKPFPIPHHWTRYTALDTHPRKPHALLWCAVDPHGNRWYYREFWPSKVCHQYIDGKLVGTKGGVPEDDYRWTVKQFVETWKFLESAENPDNNGKDEEIFRRVIDYAARAQGKGTTDDDPEMHPDMQARFEKEGRDIGFYLNFVDATKGHDVGYELVNEGLLPREEYDPATDSWVKRSPIRIFNTCPELIYQLQIARFQNQTAAKAETEDPGTKRIDRRNDLCDTLQYCERSKPKYIDTSYSPPSDWNPISSGVNY